MSYDYPSNSHRSKEAARRSADIPTDKKIERVVTGEVTRRKKGLGRQFKETFIEGDAESIWSYIMFDLLIPAAKDTAADVVSQTVERMLFGEPRSTTRRYGPSYRQPDSNSRTNYSSYSYGSRPRPASQQQPEYRTSLSRRARATHDFDEIVLESRGEAEEVIDRMFSIISQYEVVTVYDLYEMIGVTGEFTDNNYGWTDLRGAGVTRTRNGYLLDIPRPEPLK